MKLRAHLSYALLLAAVGCNGGSGNHPGGAAGTSAGAGASGSTGLAGTGGTGGAGTSASAGSGGSGSAGLGGAGSVAVDAGVDAGDSNADGVVGTHSGACTGDFMVRTPHDVEAIKGCTSIDGRIDVESTALQTLSLPNLTELGTSISVANNMQLTTLDLPVLAKVGDTAATPVQGLLSLNENPALTTLNLAALQYVGAGGFGVVSAVKLKSLSAPLLTKVDGVCEVYANWELTMLNLPVLATIGGDLQMTSNLALTGLSLPALTSVTGAFQVQGNDLLASVDFPKLTTVSGPTFELYGNAVLPTCQAKAVLDHLVGYAGTSNIMNMGSCP